ncbi:MAG: hypothetical protein IPL35_00220 [Sphingobacteriales bacterium]|nr:hypothetical protein [Sphingobacteriales bacterium]
MFYEVGGFDQIDTVASGDDLLLIQKIAAYYPQGISFLKNTAAIVTTAACPTWKDFLQQRIRWASKSHQYNDWKIKSILLGVYLLNVSLLFLPLVALFDIRWCWVWIFQIFVKIIADYFFLKEAVSFFGRGDLMRIFYLPNCCTSFILYGQVGQATGNATNGKVAACNRKIIF